MVFELIAVEIFKFAKYGNSALDRLSSRLASSDRRSQQICVLTTAVSTMFPQKVIDVSRRKCRHREARFRDNR